MSLGVDHDTDEADDEPACEVLLDEVLTERAFGDTRQIGVGPDGAVHVFFWDGESLIASRRAPEGGWSEQVLQGQSLDSPDFPALRVAAGGRAEPSLLMLGSYRCTLWQLREGLWERRFSEDGYGDGSAAPVAVSPGGTAHFAFTSAGDPSLQQLHVLPPGADTPRLELTFFGLDPLLAVDGESQWHVLYQEASDSPRWWYQGVRGAAVEAFTAESARPVFAVAQGRLAALYRDDAGLTQLATERAGSWQSTPLGTESGEECGEAWDRPVAGQTCQHRSHRYSAWALAGGSRLALVAFERDEEGRRVADCTSPELGCVWVDDAGFVERSRLVFGTVGHGRVRFAEMPVEVPTGTAPTWRHELDQGTDGTLHLLLSAANEWELAPLRYVRVRCDDP